MACSDEALMEIFGTTYASNDAIVKWKSTWRDTKGRIGVESYSSASRMLAENDIDPLMYQFSWHDGSPHIVFYRDGDEVFFKIHQHGG